MAIGERVVFLPFVPHAAYLRINRLCDVMLDTLHWSGGNTTLDAIASALPVVTLPGALMRGRQSLGMLRIVGVPELAAGSVDEYVEFALRLGGSAEERDAFSRRIEAGRAALFGRAEPIRALEDLLERVAGEDR
jgi:predicted O-linked N-acetylglucosamine transferase (SPINDLY family)